MTHFRLFGVLSILCVPHIAQAQTVQMFAAGLMSFLLWVVVPFLLTIAFLFFVINVLRYFVVESDDVTKRANAKNLALYGILAFVLISIFWGLVNLIAGGLGLRDQVSLDCVPVPDYINPLGFECAGGSRINPHADISGVPYNPTSNPHEGNTGVEYDPTENPHEGVGDLPDSTENPHDGNTGVEYDPTENPHDGNTGVEYDPTESPHDWTDDSDVDLVALGNALEAIDNAESGLDFIADGYFAEGNANIYFGEYVDNIQESDLLNIQAAGNDEERLQVAYRLYQLGAIDEPQYNEYRDALNARREISSMPLIEYEHPDIAVDDIPTGIAEQMQVNQNMVEGQIRDLNDTVAQPVDVSSAMNTLYGDELSYAERIDYATNELGAVFNDPDVFDQYLDSLQTEKFLRGVNIWEPI